MSEISQAVRVRAMLEWYQAMGVDEVIAETPLDWASATFETRRLQNQPKRSVTATPKPERVAKAAHQPRPGSDVAALATLDAVETALAEFDGCGLKRTAKSLCFARGSPSARVMLIGEAPGRDEDLQGRPFVGRAGQLLDRMLRSISLDPSDVYITNVVYWRPPGNRNPSPQEVEACRPFLMRQIELVAPEIMVLLGGAAAKHMLGTSEGIMKLRGKWRNISMGGHSCRAIATLHPAYLLRSPLGKRLAWRDLLMIYDALDGSG